MNGAGFGPSGLGVAIGGSSAAPTVQASSLIFSSIIDTGFTLTWTNGNGNGRIVLIKQGSAVDASPVNGLFYNANVNFGSGDQIGTGNYVVFAGATNSVAVTGLTIGTTYHVKVFEYNQPAFTYLTITATGNPASQITSTEPSIQASAIVFPEILDTQVTLSWTSGNGTKRLILVKSGSIINSNPVDNNTYTANAAFGSGSQLGTGNYCVYNGTGNSTTVTGLTLGVTYYFQIFEYGGTAGSENYFTSTAFDNPTSQAIDFLGPTLIDEWVSNNGLVLKTGQGTYLSQWIGSVNNIIISNNGNTPKPVAGILNLDASASPLFSGTSVNVNGDVVFAFLIQKTAQTGTRVTLVNATLDSPTLRVDLELGSSDHSMGIVLAGVTYSSGALFTYDSNYHAIVYTINPSTTSFKVFMDGAQVGSTQTIPATAINLTTTTNKTLFSFQFVGKVKKMRIYNAGISNTILQAITNTANPFYTTMVIHRPAHVLAAWGQSNMVGSTLVATDYPAYLQASMPSIYYFETFTRFNALLGSHPSTCGADIKAVYDLAAHYPNDDIFYTKAASANTALDVYWKPTATEGSGYSGLVDNYNRIINTLLAENRTIVEYSLIGMQGEEDAEHLDQANAYETNLTNFNTNIRAATGLLNHAYGRLHSHLPTTGSNARPYANTVRTAQVNVANADAHADYVDTDDSSTGHFELRSDSVHFNAVGETTLGAALASILISLA